MSCCKCCKEKKTELRNRLCAEQKLWRFGDRNLQLQPYPKLLEEDRIKYEKL